MLSTTGIPDKEQIAAVLPCEARKKEGAVAIIECYQEIPATPAPMRVCEALLRWIPFMSGLSWTQKNAMAAASV